MSTRFYILCFILTLLCGCASQGNVSLPPNFWQQSKQTVTVVKVAKPKPYLYQAGPEGLLDYAINASVNHDFSDFLTKTDITWYDKLPQDIMQQLTKRGMAAEIAAADIPANDSNYQPLASKLNKDNLLVFKLEKVGALRNYYGFIPLGAPQAYCVLSGQLIDKQNKVIWRYRSEATQVVKGNWDQPPVYPNFAKALSIAMNNARQDMLNNLLLPS